MHEKAYTGNGVAKSKRVFAMKWAICTEDFPPDFIGGLSSWCSDLAYALHSKGEEVTVKEDLEPKKPEEVIKEDGWEDAPR